MTPRLAICRAPADSVTLTIAGSNSGRQADRQRDGEQERIDQRPLKQQVDGEYEEHDRSS